MKITRGIRLGSHDVGDFRAQCREVGARRAAFGLRTATLDSSNAQLPQRGPRQCHSRPSRRGYCCVHAASLIWWQPSPHPIRRCWSPPAARGACDKVPGAALFWVAVRHLEQQPCSSLPSYNGEAQRRVHRSPGTGACYGPIDRVWRQYLSALCCSKTSLWDLAVRVRTV